MSGRRGGSNSGKRKDESKFQRQLDWEERQMKERRHGRRKGYIDSGESLR
jgi:hypothetical protein